MMDIQEIIELVKKTKKFILNREMVLDVKERGIADYVTQVDITVQNFLKEDRKSIFYFSCCKYGETNWQYDAVGKCYRRRTPKEERNRNQLWRDSFVGVSQLC